MPLLPLPSPRQVESLPRNLWFQQRNPSHRQQGKHNISVSKHLCHLGRHVCSDNIHNRFFVLNCRPTRKPTVKPSKRPSARPTVKKPLSSSKPVSPSPKPSNVPVAKPTKKPTNVPGGKPSASPTKAPVVPVVVVRTPTSAPVSTNCYNLNISLRTDNYGSETSMILLSNNIVYMNTSSQILLSNTDYGATVCLSQSACSNFSIYDAYGDGMCCSYGKGYYNLTWNGMVWSYNVFLSSKHFR
jgi:hypothetical protein